MPSGQQYGTNVPQTTIPGGITAGATSWTVASSTGWPTPPFTATLDIASGIQEAVDVGAVVGTAWSSITRGVDGTTAVAHPGTPTLTHTDIGRDFREARSHIDASSSNDASGHAVHGLGGGSSVVGTTDTQTLSNKTLVHPIMTSVPSVDAVLLSGLTGATSGAARLAGSTNGGPPTSGTFLTGDFVYDILYQGQWLCTAGGTPGTWVPVGGRMLIKSTILGSSSSTFTASAIPGFWRNLTIELVAMSDNAGGTGYDPISLTINGLSAGYGYQNLEMPGTGALTQTQRSSQANWQCGVVWSSHIGTSAPGATKIELPFYTKTSYNKTARWVSEAGDGSAIGDYFTGSGAVLSSTSAITSLIVSTTAGSFLTGSSFRLFGEM